MRFSIYSDFLVNEVDFFVLHVFENILNTRVHKNFESDSIKSDLKCLYLMQNDIQNWWCNSK